MTRRQYSDSEKATALAALDANGGNVSRTAKQLNIARKTLAGWAESRGVHPEVADLRHEKRLDRSELIDEEIRAIFEAMKKKRKGAWYSHLVVGLGVLIDKKQLLEGKATERKEVTGRDGTPIEITVLSELSDDELDRIINNQPPER